MKKPLSMGALNLSWIRLEPIVAYPPSGKTSQTGRLGMEPTALFSSLRLTGSAQLSAIRITLPSPPDEIARYCSQFSTNGTPV